MYNLHAVQSAVGSLRFRDLSGSELTAFNNTEMDVWGFFFPWSCAVTFEPVYIFYHSQYLSVKSLVA